MHATISVIIPSYRRRRFAEAAVRSVLAQTRPASEVLLLLDGEDTAAYDGIEAVIADDRLRVVRPGKHLGLTAIKNLGVARASSDVVAFLDDDDFWYPSKLEQQMEAVEAAGVANGFVSATAFHAASPTSVELWPGRHPNQDEPVGDFLLTSRDSSRNCVLQASTFMASRHVAVEIPFRGQAFEDWDWIIRATNRYPFVFSPAAGGQFRVGDANTMTTGTSLDDARAWFDSIEDELTDAARSGFHATVLARLIGSHRALGEAPAALSASVAAEPHPRELAEFPLRLVRAWRSSRRNQT